MRRSVALQWDVLGARVTMLHDSKPVERSLWQLMHGAQAENISKRGTRLEESGSVNGQSLTLLDQPNRIDLLLAPGSSNPSPDTPQLSRVTFEVIVRRLVPLISKLTAIAELPSANRLAFGVSLSRTFAARAEAIAALAQVFPELSKELPQSENFIFQINHPKKEAIGDLQLEINYLHKWFFTNLRVGAGGPGLPPVDVFTANVDLDISTAAVSARKWPGNESALILQHLIRGGKRLLEESKG